MQAQGFDVLSFVLGIFGGAGGVLLAELIGWRKSVVKRKGGKPVVAATGVYSRDKNTIAVVLSITNPGDNPDTFDRWSLVLDTEILPWRLEHGGWFEGAKFVDGDAVRVESHGRWTGAVAFDHGDHLRFQRRLRGETPWERPEAIAGTVEFHTVSYGKMSVPVVVTPISLLQEPGDDAP